MPDRGEVEHSQASKLLINIIRATLFCAMKYLCLKGGLIRTRLQKPTVIKQIILV